MLPSGAAQVTDTATANVWIESTQPAQFVKRHYQITPKLNPATSTATITLYFTQQEFNNFNAVNVTKLPTGPADATGIANLLVEKRDGTSTGGTGLPGTYTGAVTNINPVDANIIWNATESRWEVKFAVTGFGGFWVKTKTGILPLTLLSFTGASTGNTHQLHWATNNEINTNRFEVEYSTDNSTFTNIGSVTASGNAGINNYQFTNSKNVAAYYRLKMIDNDGKFTYSDIIKLSSKISNPVSIYPNPVADYFTLQTSDNSLLNTKATLVNTSGAVVRNINLTNTTQTIYIGECTSGMYMLKLANGSVIKIIKK